MEAFDWTCPFCNRDTTITDANCRSSSTSYWTSGFDKHIWIMGRSIRCPNKNCKQYTFTLYLGEKADRDADPKIVSVWPLVPESNAKPFPGFIPEQLRKDYQEACLIKDKSPKASATLARRCLQGIIRDFHGIKRDTLKQEVDALKQKIAPEDWEAIDAVRSVGNIGAHMEKDVDHIVDVDPDEAELLIRLIERLFKEWYIEREERKKQMGDLVRLAKEKKTARESKPTMPQDENV